ncbi:putative glucosyltransferase [[Clostridium] ultunense Esp]|uniref:sugar phosphorylase n=1 Tax=Thermicanus aegyptius TaxID=94009 RepID=UPI0002B70F83|nr:sugar phosphorylase [Thermicanus aegyptius]CCQ96487.1 putative glucosyltransferase [[Clostridium] ultunense Esp]
MSKAKIEEQTNDKVREIMHSLYKDQGEKVLEEINRLMGNYRGKIRHHRPWVSENDVILITYGDTIREEGKPSLKTLQEFLGRYVKDHFTGIHILPFYPYSSDDGFSVVDYERVNPKLGTWADIHHLANHYDLMFDAVINHISRESRWFQGYLKGDIRYKDYFIEADPEEDYSAVIRPRALPLLTPFETSQGKKYIWTTFSEDQIDLNYKNPNVLLEVLKVLIQYVLHGARFIRLDAIGFLWKNKGTSCMHLTETHLVVKLFRAILDQLAPGTILVTETNVPHHENIRYFGNGYDESHMVYQFPLPPLVLFSFLTGNARKLMAWADGIEATTENTTFFNFLASHDGIGMRPTEGILDEDERNLMITKTLEHGGYVSYKGNGDGTQSPYELNINYLDALTHPQETEDRRIKRFVAAHAILLSMVGVPGIYIHSLLGSRSDRKGVEQSGIYRRINREKLEKQHLFWELESDTLRSRIFSSLCHLIRIRRSQRPFSPNSKQEILFFDDRLFSVLRTHEESREEILSMVNVSDEKVHLHNDRIKGFDLIDGTYHSGSISLDPYQVMWIKMS